MKTQQAIEKSLMYLKQNCQVISKKTFRKKVSLAEFFELQIQVVPRPRKELGLA